MRYWIGLGANLGDRLSTLRRAVTALGKHGTIGGCSRVWASSPVGGPPQPPFLNAAVALDSELAPDELLRACHAIEAALGRDRASETVRWGPRTLDVDLLLAGARGEQRIDTPDLQVPHPRLHQRAFALAPLVDLDANLLHPTEARPLKTLLHAAQAHQGDAVAPTGDTL